MDGHGPMTIALCFAALVLAYINGANSNFKGVASLYGSQTTSYSAALILAAVSTFAGSVAAGFSAKAYCEHFPAKDWSLISL